MINRHNYEEFFLMYVDNELTAQQRSAVESFMQQNPDLSNEMEMLQQARLLPDDDLFFSDKEILLKGPGSIGVESHEAYFLNYIDEELNPAEKQEVEKFVLQHPQFQEAFTLLKQTKLDPETIIFEDKQSLYRKEEPRIIPLILKRFAIAAIFTGIGVALWMMLPKTNNQVQVAQTQPEDKKHNIVQQVDTSNKQQLPANTGKAQQSTVALADEKEKQKVQDKATVVKKQNKPVPVVTPVQHAQANDNSNIAAIDNNTVQNQNATVDNNAVAANINHSSNNSLIDNSTNANEQKQKDIYAYQNTHSDISSTDANYAKPAVYKEINTDEDANSNTLYVGSVGLNKNKVRGIMKKVGGIFSGKTKNAAEGENGKLQVAGFQLNTN